jgi:hypothetical protein
MYLFRSSSLICLDSGHLTFKGGERNIQNTEVEEDIFYDAKVFQIAFFSY